MCLCKINQSNWTYHFAFPESTTGECACSGSALWLIWTTGLVAWKPSHRKSYRPSLCFSKDLFGLIKVRFSFQPLIYILMSWVEFSSDSKNCSMEFIGHKRLCLWFSFYFPFCRVRSRSGCFERTMHACTVSGKFHINFCEVGCWPGDHCWLQSWTSCRHVTFHPATTKIFQRENLLLA